MTSCKFLKDSITFLSTVQVSSFLQILPAIKSALLQTKSQELSNEPSELCFRLFPNFSDKQLLSTLYPFDTFTSQNTDSCTLEIRLQSTLGREKRIKIDL